MMMITTIAKKRIKRTIPRRRKRKRKRKRIIITIIIVIIILVVHVQPRTHYRKILVEREHVGEKSNKKEL